MATIPGGGGSGLQKMEREENMGASDLAYKAHDSEILTQRYP